MGRTLKRVPMDFDYPLDTVWYGYYLQPSFCHENYSAGCEECKEFARIMGVEISEYGCPNFDGHFQIHPSIEPPQGDGYQLWETTSEGSPQSPVFSTLDELCEWCEKNASTFGDSTASKEQWKAMLEADFVHHADGNAIFL